MWAFKLAAIGIAIAMAWAAIHSYNVGQQEKGAAEIQAKYEKAKADQAEEDARINMEGKKAVLRLLATAEQRKSKDSAATSALETKRRADSDARAKDDKAYSLWREQSVPKYAVDRLRLYTELPVSEQGSRVVSPGTALPASQDVSSDNRTLYQRIVGGMGFGVSRANAPGVAGSGPSK